MRKKLLLFTMLIMCGLTYAQTHLFVHPKFKQLTSDHKVLAVVPFETTISLRPRKMKEISHEQLREMQEAEGLSVQNSMYSWFKKREKRGEFDKKVQTPHTTNALLKKNGITYENLNEYTPQELASVLGVDAVILGTFETTQPMSDGASIALGMLVGFWGSTNKAVINMFIHNASDGEVLANYNKGVAGSLGSSTDDLINKLMRKASRRIDYSSK